MKSFFLISIISISAPSYAELTRGNPHSEEAFAVETSDPAEPTSLSLRDVMEDVSFPDHVRNSYKQTIFEQAAYLEQSNRWYGSCSIARIAKPGHLFNQAKDGIQNFVKDKIGSENFPKGQRAEKTQAYMDRCDNDFLALKGHLEQIRKAGLEEEYITFKNNRVHEEEG